MGGKKLTKKWLKNHMTYSWWKYAVLAAVCILGVNLVFTMTAYRVPEEKKVEVKLSAQLNQPCSAAVSPLSNEVVADVVVDGKTEVTVWIW